jgi:hypothetical protein
MVFGPVLESSRLLPTVPQALHGSGGRVPISVPREVD